MDFQTPFFLAEMITVITASYDDLFKTTSFFSPEIKAMSSFLWKVKPSMDLSTELSDVRFIMSKTISRYIFEIRINNLE